MMQIRASGSLVPGLLALLLWANNAQAVPCQNNLPASNPDSVYIDHGDGTVTDTRTDLMWKQCVEGMSDETCQTGSPQSFTWGSALIHAEASTFANYTDWRLPNVKELSSLVEDCRESPTLNTNFFPDPPPVGLEEDRSVWSGSPYASDAQRAWLVEFRMGGVSRFGRLFFNQSRVRLVRGGQ